MLGHSTRSAGDTAECTAPFFAHQQTIYYALYSILHCLYASSAWLPLDGSFKTQKQLIIYTSMQETKGLFEGLWTDIISYWMIEWLSWLLKGCMNDIEWLTTQGPTVWASCYVSCCHLFSERLLTVSSVRYPVFALLLFHLWAIGRPFPQAPTMKPWKSTATSAYTNVSKPQLTRVCCHC